MPRPYDSENRPDGRRFAPATERNREPLIALLKAWLPTGGGSLLEIASGSGEHAVHIAPELEGWTWQPSDFDPPSLESIKAWTTHAGVMAQVKPPIALDVLSNPWPVEGPVDAVFCANMVHIAPQACTGALVRGAGHLLKAGGRFMLYGPFMVDGKHTAPSNAAFDASLRSRDPSWGIRDKSDIVALAKAQSLKLMADMDMPANNQTLVFEKQRD